ncbi:hypothetical protein N7507_010388 [Penicillium longicatenatum]|nr:hypothetical protein N7507_010388 [Penicillium longicatenatum]
MLMRIMERKEMEMDPKLAPEMDFNLVLHILRDSKYISGILLAAAVAEDEEEEEEEGEEE